MGLMVAKYNNLMRGNDDQQVHGDFQEYVSVGLWEEVQVILLVQKQ